MINVTKGNPINKSIQKIWDETRNNKNLRDGEKNAILKSLKEIHN